MQRKPNLERAIREILLTNRVWLVDGNGHRMAVNLDTYEAIRDRLPPSVRVRATEIDAAATAAGILNRN